MPALYVNLMPKYQDLGYQRSSRPEQPDQRRPNKAASFPHRTEGLRDSASDVSPIRFTTGTGHWVATERPCASPSSSFATLVSSLNSRCSILGESDSTLGYEQVFSPLEYRSDAASAAECAGLRAERP